MIEVGIVQTLDTQQGTYVGLWASYFPPFLLPSNKKSMCSWLSKLACSPLWADSSPLFGFLALFAQTPAASVAQTSCLWPLPLKLQLYVACMGNLSILVLPRAGLRLEFVFCFSSAMSWMNNLFVFPIHLLAATCFFFGGTHFRLFENFRYPLWRNSWLVSAMYTTNMYGIQDFPKQVPFKKRDFLEGLYLVGSD